MSPPLGKHYEGLWKKPSVGAGHACPLQEARPTEDKGRCSHPRLIPSPGISAACGSCAPAVCQSLVFRPYVESLLIECVLPCEQTHHVETGS